jgi:choline dehydrogenase-like flavoprotein
MHIDARKIADHSVIEGDICIVGAGAAGISMALDWIGTRHKVILLEGGGFEYDDQVQELYAGKTSGQKYYPLKSARLHYFGGTTGHWAGLCSPFDPIDFEKRDWIPHSGWPITRKDLDPFYARANQKLKLGPYEYGLDYWRKENPRLKPFPLDQNVVWSKVWQSSAARFNSLYKDQIVKAKNVHLYTYANVIDIRANEPISSIQHVIVKNHAGKTHTVKAKHFILACCAIQNARLLLASNTQAPHGLGNNHDLVGRYFMEHLEINSAELWLFKPFPTDLYSWDYGTTKPVAELALAAKMQREHKISNGTASLIPLKWGRHAKPRIETWQDQDPRKSEETMFKDFGEATQKSKTETQLGIDNAFELDIRIEQSPNPDSRVTLAGEKDALGVPRAHLHWALTALDKRSIRTIFQILGQEFGKAGLGRVKLMDYLQVADNNLWPDYTNAGWHHMGTTRMGDDPRTGVVDANCKVHGIENLYVAGSGCYTTAAAPNPTLTVVALSLRLSDHVRSKLGSA